MITVLIAAYNAAPFISRAILSALEQGSVVYEILVVDDASTDDTRAVVEKFSKDDPRVKLLTMDTNGGPAKARNRGVTAAASEWIAVLDADDAMIQGRLDRMFNVASTNQADIVIDNFRWYSPATPSSPENVGSAGIREAAGHQVIRLEDYVSNARPFNSEADWGLLKPLFRTAFLRANQVVYPENSRHGEDFLLMVDAFLKGAKCILLREAGYLYTYRGAGLSRTVVNYDLQVEHTRQLMSDEKIRNNQEICAALEHRADALKRLSAEWKLRKYADERDVGAIVGLLIKHPEARAPFLRLVRQKIEFLVNRAARIRGAKTP